MMTERNTVSTDKNLEELIEEYRIAITTPLTGFSLRMCAKQSIIDYVAKEAVKPYTDFISYVLSCRKNNTIEWMEGLIEEINFLAGKLGEDDTFSYKNGGIVKKVIK